MDQPKPQLLKLIDHNRAIKTQLEIFYIKSAAVVLDEVFSRVKEYIEIGQTELEVALFIEKEMEKLRVKELAFTPIVAFGKNSADIHHWPTKQPLKKGDQVMVDMGTVDNGYCSDMTRMLFMGTPTKKQEQVYKAVLKAQIAGVKRVRSGIKGEQVDAAVRKVLKDAKLNIYFTHNLGHGVGQYIHEWPRLGTESKDVLQENMVVTVEPGVYIKGWGGIRIEDMAQVKDKGREVLTETSKDLKDNILSF